MTVRLGGARPICSTSSPRRGAASESRRLADDFLRAFRRGSPDASVDLLDLWAEPLLVFAGDHVAAKMTVIEGRTLEGCPATAWDEITRLYERFSEADTYLFNVPMWNHGVPWVLKHLIDTITHVEAADLGALFAARKIHGRRSVVPR